MCLWKHFMQEDPMSRRDVSTVILGLQGWEIMDQGMVVDQETEDLTIHIVATMGTGYRCSRCGAGMLFAYDHMETRHIRDFPWAGRRCDLELTLARVDCPTCGVAVEGLSWLEPSARHTLRYEKYVARLCSLMPATDVAELEGLVWHVALLVNDVSAPMATHASRAQDFGREDRKLMLMSGRL
jgi:transposase